MVRYRYTPEVLAEAAAAAHSVTEVMRLLGVRVSGGSHAHISRRLKHFGIDTTHFTGQAHSRGRPGRSRPSHEVLVRLPPNARRIPGARLRRALAFIGLSEECEVCEVGPVWQGRPLTLHVDHVNGDFLDNRPPNLRFLCPNCHSQTDTYAGRNQPATAEATPVAVPLRTNQLNEADLNRIVSRFGAGELTGAEAARLIGCHRNSLYRLVRRQGTTGTAAPQRGRRPSQPSPEARIVIQSALAHPDLGARRLANLVRAATDGAYDLGYGRVAAILRSAGLNTVAARRSRLTQTRGSGETRQTR
ncbi:hypothetical protein [Micromonospora sp. NPDC126480]|uniref:hypothetical protein n=1 Tax=Micromonospora sp. NPDC126480 TaxID=3155312 RepID=UPI003321D1AA